MGVCFYPAGTSCRSWFPLPCPFFCPAFGQLLREAIAGCLRCLSLTPTAPWDAGGCRLLFWFAFWLCFLCWCWLRVIPGILLPWCFLLSLEALSAAALPWELFNRGFACLVPTSGLSILVSRTFGSCSGCPLLDVSPSEWKKHKGR